jgi:hypothetical protein
MTDLVIDINAGEAFKQDAHAPVRGGGTRLVRMVPTAIGNLPIIWISHEITKNDEGIPVYQCLLLDNKTPPHALPAEITVEAFKTKNFPMTSVEW